MLFDFHKTQNTKKPNSVHATYLITGRHKPEVKTNGAHSNDGDDVSMRSSPPISSLPKSESQHEDELLPITTVTLVREEDLEDVQAQFEEIRSIFIYSLESSPIQDLQLLTESNRKVAREYTSEDPLVEWKKYGVIQNPNAKRRTTKRPPPVAASGSSTSPSASKFAQPKKEEPKSFFSTTTKSKPSPAKQSEAKPSTTRRDSSNISSMFANAKTKPKTKAGGTGSGSSAATPANASSPAEDSPMKDVDDDEGGDDDLVIVVDDGKAETARKERREREEKLRAMMDEEDEDMPDADSRPRTADEMQQEAEAEVDDSGALDARKEKGRDEEKEDVRVEGGRRRGRRKVMKKKTVKDDDGFLVTTEEAVWESFSEEEPEVKKPKLQSGAFGSMKGASGKKGGAKGQGNIMNFFKKG